MLPNKSFGHILFQLIIRLGKGPWSTSRKPVHYASSHHIIAHSCSFCYTMITDIVQYLFAPY